MSLSLIDTGTNQDDGTGDTLRGAFVKVNENFTEIYNELGGTVLSNLRMSGNTITTDNTNGTIILNPNGTGAVQVEAALVVDSSITATSLQINGDANITGTITGSYSVTDLTATGSVTIGGDLTVGGTLNLGDDTTLTTSWNYHLTARMFCAVERGPLKH